MKIKIKDEVSPGVPFGVHRQAAEIQEEEEEEEEAKSGSESVLSSDWLISSVNNLRFTATTYQQPLTSAVCSAQIPDEQKQLNQLDGTGLTV